MYCYLLFVGTIAFDDEAEHYLLCADRAPSRTRRPSRGPSGALLGASRVMRAGEISPICAPPLLRVSAPA
jgi:hypothetical protein